MRRLQLVFLLFGAALGAFYPFVAVILAERGFSPTEIGLTTAVASVAFSLAVPVWGHLADVVLGRVGALRLAAAGCAVALLGFGLPWPALVLGLLYVGFMVFESAIGPLADALAVNALADPARHYGRIRLLSSVAIAFAFGGVIAGFTYLGLRIVELAGRPSDVALSAAVAAFAEIPAMVVAGAAAARYGLRILFAGAALLYAVCLGAWIGLADVGLIIATRALTGPAFAGLWVGAVLAMRALLPDRLQGTGQGVFQVAAFGIGALVANGAGGVVYGLLGHGALFGLAAASAVVGKALAWRTLPRRRPVGRS